MEPALRQNVPRTPKDAVLRRIEIDNLCGVNCLVSRAGLEPATTALKVRRGGPDLRFHAQNTGVSRVRPCTGLHRVLDIRYQTW